VSGRQGSILSGGEGVSAGDEAAVPGVLVRYVEDLLRAAARSGVTRRSLLEGIALQGPGGRIPWDDFVLLMQRLERELGGAEALEAFGEGVTGARIVPVLRRVAGITASPIRLYRASVRWALRRAMPVLHTSLEEWQGADARARLRFVCEVPAPARPCPQILHVAVGGLRALPRVFGLPDALVEASVGERRGVYTVSLPPPATPWGRVRLALRAFFSSRAAFEQLAAQQGELRSQYDALRAAHAELAENEARYRALAESAIDIVAEVGSDGMIRYLSPSATEATGFARDAMLGTPFGRWLHPDDLPAVEGARLEALAGVARGRPVCRVRRQGGGWVWLEMEGRSYHSRTGEARLVVILRDVSERVRLDEDRRRHQADLEAEVARRTDQLERRNRELRELQALLLEAERLGTAHDVAGRVAHSINNPLGALIGHLQLALEDGGLTPRRIERLLDLARRVSDVVDRTLRFYRENKIDRAPVGVASLLEEVRSQVAGRAKERGVRIELRCDPPDLVAEVDRTLLVSALASLVENGIDATVEGGLVEISARCDAPGRLLLVRVANEGPGVPVELRERIFEPFFTTRGSRGTGLGLPIAQGVVHGHDGRLRVVDRGDGPHGALFILELPLEAAPGAPSSRAEPALPR
jgi:PAS domain S-box-containing protein